MGTAPVCSLGSELSGVFSGPSAGHGNVYLNRQPSISPENMDLSRISRELQFRSHLWQPLVSLDLNERSSFYRGDKGGGGAGKQSVCFSLANSWREEGASFPLGSAMDAGVRAPPAGRPALFKWIFCALAL